MRPVIKVKAYDNMPAVKKSIEDFSKMEVYVGIPETDSARKTGSITNAQLAFVHTHGVRVYEMQYQVKKNMNAGLSYQAATQMYIHAKGSPLFHIPPRPIIEPAIEAKGNKEVIVARLGEAGKAALDGKPAKRLLNMAGMEAQNRVRAWFTDPRNNWAPNAPSTIARKGSNRPLIDTGELRKSITYVVAEKGA